MIKYNSDQKFVVQDLRLLEAPKQKLGCRRSQLKIFINIFAEKTQSI
jgi:hypothetical protein